MIGSPRQAREAVYNQLMDYGSGKLVSKGDKQLTRPVAVRVGTDGMDPDFYWVAVRIWVALDQQNLGNAYDMLDDHLHGIDNLLANGPYGPSQWDIAGQDDPPLLIATCVLHLGRE